jgi:hypothetical protein
MGALRNVERLATGGWQPGAGTEVFEPTLAA